MYCTSVISLDDPVVRMTNVQPSADEAILQAAALLFRKNGVAGTSMRAIAESSGVLLGSVTYRFRTKEALVIALMQRAVRRVSAEVLAAVGTSLDPNERLRLALRAHLRAVLGGDDAVYVLMFDWPRLPSRTRDALAVERRRYEAIWDGLIFAAAGAGQLVAELDLPLVRKFAFGAANSVAFWFRPNGPRTPDEIADAFSAFIGLGTLAPHARPASPLDAYRALGAVRAEAVNPTAPGTRT